MPVLSPPRPAKSEYNAYYQGYIDEAPGDDVLAALAAQRDSTARLLAGVPESLAGHRYAPGKWSIRGVIGHLADTERVFSYRALRVARGDTVSLPSFDENAWMAADPFEHRPLAEVAAEFRAVRDATLALFRGFPSDAWARLGTASNHPISARALAWIISGHEAHHVRVLKERYLPR